MWQLLIQFIFRMTFGVALAMGITPPRWVSSGFYRVHLWVLLGINTFAALAIFSQRGSLAARLENVWLLLALAVSLAMVSYAGGVIWLYERAAAGRRLLYLIAAGGLLAAVLATPWHGTDGGPAVLLVLLDLATSGLLLGVTVSSMFLGHWYLNTPTMQLSPLKRLVALLMLATVARAVVSGTGLALQAGQLETTTWIFVALRWLSGLLAVWVMAWLTWFALRIPNTQSATGILYAAVILAFIGELTSQLLSVDAGYPL